jgi:hypothetical protein
VRSLRLVRSLFCLLPSVFCLLFPAAAAAQQKEPLPPFVADIHGIFARHKSEPSVATELGVESGNLPSRSFGLVGGGHVYVLRGRPVTIGFGGTFLYGGGSDTIETTNADGSVTTSPTVQRHFRSVNPEISLNFGHRQGWSYISGGFGGRSRMYLERTDKPASDVPLRATLTYGAGARWFANEHVAFSVEVRWYSIAEQPASPATNVLLEPRTTLMVLSGGISLK